RSETSAGKVRNTFAQETGRSAVTSFHRYGANDGDVKANRRPCFASGKVGCRRSRMGKEACQGSGSGFAQPRCADRERIVFVEDRPENMCRENSGRRREASAGGGRRIEAKVRRPNRSRWFERK